MKKKTTRRKVTRKATTPPPRHVVPSPAARYFVEVRAIGQRKGSPDDMKLRLIRRVLFLARRWRHHMDEELRASGYSHARWITLLWVDLLDGHANHRELAERVGVELPTLIRLLNRLETEGFVKRRSLHTRGLSKTVEMTASGRTKLRAMTRIVRKTRVQFTSGLDQKKVGEAVKLLDTLLAKYATVIDLTHWDRPD